MILSIFAVESEAIVAVKAIREALRVLYDAEAEGSPEPRPGLAAAKAVLDAFREDGVAKLGETDDADGAANLILALRANGVFATTGSPERALRYHRAERLRQEGATPEEAFAALAPGDAPEAPAEPPAIRPDAGASTALALMQMADGNPLAAAAFAATLSRAQGEASIPMWRVVQRFIIATYPFIQETLSESGVLL